MSGTVTVPGLSGGTISLPFLGTANLGMAQQIANALAAAKTAGSLNVVAFNNGAPPVLGGTPGQTDELALSPTVTGSVTVPAAPSGVTEVLVVNNTNPVTIYGNPGLEVIGGNGNVTVIDPATIDFGGNTTTNGPDAVTVSAADSPYTVIAGPGAVESVVGLGSGTIYGGTGGDLINVSGSSGANMIISEAASGDTVFAGAGTTTIDNTSTSHDADDFGGSGNFYVQDLGSDDTIKAGLGNASVSMGGSSALVVGGLGSLTLDAGGATGGQVQFGIGGGTFTSSSASSGALVFTAGSVSVAGSNTTNDTIVGGTSALTVNAGTAAGLVVFGPTSGTGLDFIGGSGSAAVMVAAGSDTVDGGTGALTIAVGASNETLAAAGGSAGTTLFGSTGSDINYTGSTGSLTFIAGLGNETLNASGSSSNNVFWGGTDSTANNSLIGGSGNDVFVAGPGADTFTGGGGNNQYDFFASVLSIAGSAKTDVITDFLTGSNEVALIGSVPGSLTTTSSASASGTTTVTLSDGTKIEFVGVGSATQLTGHIFSN